MKKGHAILSPEAGGGLQLRTEVHEPIHRLIEKPRLIRHQNLIDAKSIPHLLAVFFLPLD